MRFYVNAGDGTPARAASVIQLVSREETWTVTADDEGYKESISDDRYTEPRQYRPAVPRDVNRAAHRLGALLREYSAYSLIVQTGDVDARGDEWTSADVYPPNRHPRIVIQSTHE